MCKRCVLQFVIIKPLLAVVEVILELCGVFHDGSFSFTSGYLYVTIVDNFSITVRQQTTQGDPNPTLSCSSSRWRYLCCDRALSFWDHALPMV